MLHFLECTNHDWANWFANSGEPPFRAQQVVDWIFAKHVTSPAQMSNLNRQLRDRLTQSIDWSLPTIRERIDSEDGASKLLLESRRGLIESVILRYDRRVSLCVSSQIGCRLACRFCQTGKLGFMRHLDTHEILAQYVIAAQIVKAERRNISHVVFMGMGEPLDNYQASVGAANALIDRFGLNPRRVTLSTSGIAPKIKSLAHDSRASLALSLHAALDPLRSNLMPINQRWNLATLKESLRYYQHETGRKITIEYILIRNQNCDEACAKALVRFLQGLKVKVNLIPFNAHPGLEYQRPRDVDIHRFQNFLSRRSIPAPVRYSKGLDVSGACGQLAAKSVTALHEQPCRQNVLTGTQ